MTSDIIDRLCDMLYNYSTDLKAIFVCEDFKIS